MATKVFISWSGELSNKLAETFRQWLPGVLQFVKPYFTPSDIEKGMRWESDILSELESSDIGIICLTKENLSKQWILFEAGALSKNIEISRVCTILFDVETTDLTGPLTIFQSTRFRKEDFKKLVKTINNAGGEAKLEDTVLEGVYEMWWPKLEGQVNKILQQNQNKEEGDRRTNRDILEEILELTRLRTRREQYEFAYLRNLQRDNINELVGSFKNLRKSLEDKSFDSACHYCELLEGPILSICNFFRMPPYGFPKIKKGRLHESQPIKESESD